MMEYSTFSKIFLGELLSESKYVFTFCSNSIYNIIYGNKYLKSILKSRRCLFHLIVIRFDADLGDTNNSFYEKRINLGPNMDNQLHAL